MAGIILQLFSVTSFARALNILKIAIEGLIRELGEANNLPIYIQNIGLALLTILIPLAIAILTEIYRKKASLEEEFSELDLRVILDDVFRIKRLLIYSLLIFLPYIAWDISNGFVRLLEMILSIIGIGLILKTIYNVYNWIKGNVFKYRFSYLSKLENPVDLEIAWRSVWKCKNINTQNEREFFKIFSSLIENKMEKSKVDPMARLLKDFHSFIRERSLIFLVVLEEVFPKILNWNFVAWKREHEYSGQQENKGIWINWFQISGILNAIIKSVEERVFEERYAYLFFKYLKEHVNAHKDEYILVQERKGYYIEDLLRVSYQTLFEKVLSSPERFEIWNSLPTEWKVTKRNIENNENLVAKITLNNFLNWAGQRIVGTSEGLDQQLDNVSYNLFPTVDPKTWAMILIFVFSPYGENRVKSVIERRWTFGFSPRIRMFSGVSKAETKKMIKQKESAEIKDTYELTILLFRNVFSKELLEKYIEGAKALRYAKGSVEERKRLKLIETLQGILAL